MIKHYINLTNGIEVLLDNYAKNVDFHFIRIQSTACEQKRWDFIIQELDHDLLLNLALGNICIVYDYGQNGTPRALWQGVEFIKYVLSLYWLGVETQPIMRSGHNAQEYFYSEYSKLENRTFKKLDYFTKFLLTNEIRLISVGKKTTKDSQYGWYKEVLQENQT